MDNEKCFIYCRQSSGQDDAENSVSIQQQIKNCRDKAEMMRIEVVDIFCDANISGKAYPQGKLFEEIARSDRSFNQWFKQQKSSKKFRHGLGQLLQRLNEVNYIIVDEITRLHRSLAKSFLEQTITYEITTAKVKIIQVKGDTIDLAKFDQNLIQMLRTQINDEQIANQKKKSIESRRRIKDEGVLCNAKFFAGVYDGHKTFHFDPEQSKVVLFIFESILAKKSYSQIHYEVNVNYPDCLGKAKLFYESTMRHIAMQPVYAGYMYNSDKELIKCTNAPPPLISLTDFLKVQSIMAHKRGRHKHTRTDKHRQRNLSLTGFLKCGHCHSNLIVTVDNGRVYYKCKQGELAKKPQCKETRVLISHDKSHFNYGLLNSLKPLLILSFLERHRKNNWYLEGMANIEKLKQKELRLREKIQKAFDLFCDEVLDEQTYTEITKERMSQLKQLQRQMKDLELNSDFNFVRSNACLLNDITQFVTNYMDTEDIRCEEMLRECIISILSFRDCIKIETVFGEVTLARYTKDNKQKFVFPEGTLNVKLAPSGSYLDTKTVYQIEYDYRPVSCLKKKSESYTRTLLTQLQNVELYKLEDKK